MKILVTCIHYPIASGRYAVDALKRLGHDVRTVGPCTGTQIWGITVDERYVWLADLPEKGWTPDVVIHMDAHLQLERSGDMPYVVYGVDNHVRDYRQLEWDHLFLAHGHGWRMGEANVTWLPCCYDPQWHTPGPKWAERRFDVGQVAVEYPARAELRYMLYGIPNLSIVFGQDLFEGYRDAYHQSKVSIVRSANQDVAMRVFETAAMGCLVVKDRNPDDDALGLVHMKNCLMYDQHTEAVQWVAWALANQDEAEKIARAGQAWAKPHTWDVRMQTIIEWVEARLSKESGKAQKRQKAVSDD